MVESEGSGRPAPAPSATRREQAVERVLDPVRSRAEQRLQRFLDAAKELMSGAPGRDFTVGEIVERSGQSLRSFYQYFDGKHELMLALFDDTIRRAAAELEAKVAEETDPVDRLRVFVSEYAALCTPGTPLAPILVDFARTLLTEHPDQALVAFEPILALLRSLLAAGEKSHALRRGVRRDSTAAVMIQMLTFHQLSRVISGTLELVREPESTQLWDFFLYGLDVERTA